MQNSNEENFKKKYFKYKAKYLDIKDLLEGGITPEEKKAAEEKAANEAKKRCETTDKDKCSRKGGPGCTESTIFGKLLGCSFNKEKWKKEKN